jgi:hypothetical protein
MEHPGTVPDCDGLLLAGEALLAQAYRPQGRTCGAWVRDREQLAAASRIGLDFALSDAAPSPLLAGPGQACLPVLATVEPGPAALRDAWANGYHGLVLGW